MIQINKTILIGRLTNNPELRSTLHGTSVTRFTLAVNRPKGKDGKDNGADFINCIAWSKLAETIYKYCKKGNRLALEGRIQTGSYKDKDGKTRYTTDVVCENITFLNNKNDDSSENSADTVQSTEESVSSIYTDEVELRDEDLPF